MAPTHKEKALKAAERQRKRREKLKREGLYEQYKAKNTSYSRKFRERQAHALETLNQKHKARIIQDRREKNRVRKQKSRAKLAEKTTPLQGPTEISKAYSRKNSLNRAVNNVIKVLPKSPRKKKIVIRKLVDEYGEMEDNNVKKSHLLSLEAESVEAVRNFYLRDDISRMAPGKRDVVTVRTDNRKERLQKRHMYMTIKEAFGIFKIECPNIKVRLSKFAELRPPNVLLSSQTPRNVCTCVYHQNMFLALDAIHSHIPDIPSYTTEFPSSCLLEPEGDLCWFGECTHNGCGFAAKYSLPDNVKDSRATWMQWQENNGRMAKIQESGTLEDLYNYICCMSQKFMRHCFVKRQQARKYEEDKKLASTIDGVAVLQMDFAENYTCAAQDEIQSAHWNQNQVTLFTTVTWVKGKVISQVVVSDYMDHTKTAVVVYLDAILQNIPVEVKEIRIWTDGPASQFKNKFVMEAVRVVSDRYGIQLSWNFSATSHGKGPVDGIGGCLKRCATEKVTTRQCTINDAQDFVKAVEGSKVDVTFISAQDVRERETSLALKMLFENAMPIRGIAEYHWVGMDHNGNLVTKRYSLEPASQEDTSEVSIGVEANSLAVRDVELGMRYAVYWKPSHYWFVGRVLDQETAQQVRMEFIHQTAAGVNNFKATTDVDSVSIQDILIKIESPVPVSSSRCSTVKLTNEDFDRVQEAFNVYVTD